MSNPHRSAPGPLDARPARRRPLLERAFEKLLWQSRFLVLLAVIFSIVGAFVLFIIGSLDILNVVTGSWDYYVTGSASTDIHDTVVPDIIKAVDIYLIALVLLIFGLGTYKLFVSPIEPAEESELTGILDIASLDELKDKIARVVILAVVIEFFRAVVDIRFETPLSAVYLAVSVLALAGAMFLMSRAHKP